MTPDEDIEALRKVAEEATPEKIARIIFKSVEPRFAEMCEPSENDYLPFAAAVSALLSELEAVKGDLAKCGRENCMGQDVDGVARWVRKEALGRAEAALASLKEERDEAIGWLYISDDGPEWSVDHPIDSGQVPDARMVRRATAEALLEQLKDAWGAYHEGLASEARAHRGRQAAEQALSVLKGEMDSSWDQSDRGSTGAGEGSCSAGGVGRSVDDILDRVARGYGLLWAVVADGHTRSGQNVQSARRVLSALLTREGMRGGIAMLSEDERPDPQETINVV